MDDPNFSASQPRSIPVQNSELSIERKNYEPEIPDYQIHIPDSGHRLLILLIPESEPLILNY